VNLHHLWPQTYATAIKGAAVPSKLKKYKKKCSSFSKINAIDGTGIKGWPVIAPKWSSYFPHTCLVFVFYCPLNLYQLLKKDIIFYYNMVCHLVK